MLSGLRRKLGDRLYQAVRHRLLLEADVIVAELDRRALQSEQHDFEVLQRVYASTRRTEPSGHPRLDPLAQTLRDIANVRWNVKLLAAALANNLYEAGLAGPKANIPPNPTRVGLQSKLCTQADIESDWLRYWCGQLHFAPVYARKVWEYGFVLQALWEAGKLTPDSKGLGFAVGNESLPAYFAAQGIEILATDLGQNDARSKAWQETHQHSEDLEQLFRSYLVSRDKFLQLCSFQSVDMNAIPADFYGRFDFCWSMCSFEHLGSVEQGLEFVRNSIKCLKPGGVAAHTTEFNFEPGEETIDNWPTVLFQPRHMAELGKRLASDGHALLTVDFDPGAGVLDRFIDIPPYPGEPHPSLSYPESPHLRLSVDGFPTTSVGLVVRAGGAA
jgi:SAM-dependent methyltransferase